MTGASKGLQKALARAGSSVLAIAEMQPKDLLAEMSDEQKAALATELAPYAVASDDAGLKPEDKAGEDGDYDDKDGDESKPDLGKDKKEKGSEASADASATARVKAVALAVATDDNCKGKADLALAMLADDDFNGLSASGLVKLLGKTPATSSASASAGVDTEEAARAEMRSVIASTGNSKIDANADGKSSVAATHSAGWAKATARVNSLNGFGQ
jgi:hypothetical protein